MSIYLNMQILTRLSEKLLIKAAHGAPISIAQNIAQTKEAMSAFEGQADKSSQEAKVWNRPKKAPKQPLLPWPLA